MALIRRFLLRLYNFLRPERAEQELSRELTAHLILLEDEFQSQGMQPEEARVAARRASGGVEVTKELHRDARSFRWLDDARKDTRYAARLLRRNPLFALTAALSLAIGIGATTTILTVANGLLFLAPPGVAQPDRLIDITRTQDGPQPANPLLSYRTYLDIRERATTLDGVYAFQAQPEAMTLREPDGAERMFATVVTANYFTVLGVAPAAGRVFGPEERDGLGASPLVVLSHSFWTRRFNKDAGVLGRTLQLDGQVFSVAGVASEQFHGMSVVATDVWVLIGAKPLDSRFFTSRRDNWGLVGARLKPGISFAQAAAEVDAVSRALERQYTDEIRGTRLRVATSSPIPGDLRRVAAGFLSLLMAIVSLVLVIACANLAGVLLARANVRRREIAVRVAIGAGRARLIRQLLTETLLLFVLGGAAGLLLARWMTTLLLAVLPAFPIPVAVSLPLDNRVIAFATALSLVAAVLSGLAPALHASKTDVMSTLKDETQGPSDRLWLRNGFVVGQVAISIVLVIAAGLLVRALERTASVDRGFDSQDVLVASVDLSAAGHTAVTGARFARELGERIRAVPGVQAAALADRVPMGGAMSFGGLRVPGVPPPDGQGFFGTDWTVIEPGYFATLRIPLVAGRDFNAGDREGTQPVTIVSEATAQRLWPGQNAVGKYLIAQQPPSAKGSGTGSTPPAGDVALQVVGVVRDLKYGDRGRMVVDDGASPVRVMLPIVVYAPMQQRYVPRITIFARTTERQHVAREIGALVATLDANVPIPPVQPLENQSGPVYTQLRVAASVSGSVGLVGLLLAAIGIYGVTAFAVSRRTREIGIRLALGAQRADVVRLVLRQGMVLVLIGSAIGLIAAAGASRVLARLLFGVSPLDPVTFGGAALVFVAVGLVACYLPAHRATRIGAEALRYE